MNSAKAMIYTEKVNCDTETAMIFSPSKRIYFQMDIRPRSGIIVKVCDWTDLFHRGLKNGIRVASALYFLGFCYCLWCIFFIVVVVLVLFVIGLILAYA